MRSWRSRKNTYKAREAERALARLDRQLAGAQTPEAAAAMAALKAAAAQNVAAPPSADNSEKPSRSPEEVGKAEPGAAKATDRCERALKIVEAVETELENAVAAPMLAAPSAVASRKVGVEGRAPPATEPTVRARGAASRASVFDLDFGFDLGAVELSEADQN